MFGADHDASDVHDAGIDNNDLHKSAAALDQPSDGTSNPVDGGPIFSMYLKKAEEEDKETAKSWKEEADKVFLFTGLFSAVVATFISMSIQGIQENPQNASNFYLAGIHQALTNSNISLPSSPPPFSPPTYGIWVNSLWFLSLVISMTCAVLANLLQQWARKYLKVTRPRPTASEPKRARYRAFYAEGVEKFLLPWVFEALPAMLHLSVFLFFAGLVVFLWNFDPTISKLVLSWVASCVILYGYITFVPVFRRDSPYHTPLSPLAWSVVTGVPFLTFRVLERIAHLWNIVSYFIARIFSCIDPSFQVICSSLCASCQCPTSCRVYLYIPVILFSSTFTIDLNRFTEAADRHRKKLVQGLQKAAEKTALDLQTGLSRRAFMWTFDSLHEDDELELFFSSLPGFRKSNDDDDIFRSLAEDEKENIWIGLIGLLDRTFSSDSLHEPVNNQRANVCAAALDSAAFPYVFGVLSDQYGPVRSAKIAHFLRRWDDGKDVVTPMLMQAIVSSVVATAKRRDDYWFTIASDELRVRESVLRNYTPHELSLAILIHVTCQQYNHFKESSWPTDKFSKVLQAASKFKVRQTSPELQRGFCALWNRFVEEGRWEDRYDADRQGQRIARFILNPIYKVYIDIHQQTRDHASPRTRLRTSTGDSALILHMRKFPLCSRDDHHLALTTVISFAHITALVHPTSETSESASALPLVTTAPRASPAMTFTPGPGAVAEGDAANRAIIANTPEPQPSSLPSVNDPNEAIADSSREPNDGRVGGDRPPHVSHGWYDIV